MPKSILCILKLIPVTIPSLIVWSLVVLHEQVRSYKFLQRICPEWSTTYRIHNSQVVVHEWYLLLL